MKRITIICSESDKDTILGSFDVACPFSPYTDICHDGDEEVCGRCIEQNIEFKISDGE
jgi:hypothetical protein